MNEEFWLLSASLEDFEPKGYSPALRDEAIEAPSAMDPLPPPAHQDEGCVALLFGRTRDARTVCVRVQGVLPSLFFDDDGDQRALVRELNGELHAARQGKRAASVAHVERRTFARLYGYDPDPDTGKLKGHPYLEVFFSSLSAWRAVRRARYLAQVQKYQSMLAIAVQEEAGLQKRHDAILRGRMSGAAPHEEGGDALTARLKEVRTVEIPALRERLASFDEDEDAPAACGTVPAAPRLAHEMHVEPLTAFLQTEGLRSASWVSVSGAELADAPISTCDVELVVRAQTDSLKSKDPGPPPPSVTLYWDIETSGLDPNDARVLQVGMVFAYRGFEKERAPLRVIVSLGSVEREGWLDASVVIYACDTEEEVLATFALLVRQHDPDFVVAYNGVNFDNPFMARRAELLQVDDFWYLSRTPTRPCRLREQKLSSGGRGDNKLRYFAFLGRANLDQYVFFSVEFTQEPSTKLDHFARKILNDQKKPMDYSEIVPCWKEGPGGRGRIANYCLHDCVLLSDLDDACKITLGTCVMAHTVDVLFEQVYFRGQQLRFVAQLRRRARERVDVTGFPQLMNEPEGGFLVNLFSKFKGATVNDPEPGFYRTPVVVLDWASLYPSIMKAANLSHDSLVYDPELQRRADVERIVVSDTECYYFVRKQTHQGILPEMLEVLQAKRSEAKKEMKKQTLISKDAALSAEERERGALGAVMADLLQKSIKICSNSIYGATGASVGSYPCVAISACTTAKGREAMVIKKEALPRLFPELGSRVVYGDTDSIFLTFDAAGADVQKAGRMAEEVAARLTQHFTDELGWAGMELEHEKAFLPLHLQGKKRYFGLKYEPDPSKDVLMQLKGMDAKGVETQRRSTIPFLKKLLEDLMDTMLKERGGGGAKTLLEERLQLIVDKKVSMDDLVQRQRLSSKAEDKADVNAAARVNVLREEREPGSAKALNEWVEWVTVLPRDGLKLKDVKATDMAEDIDFARKNPVKLNFGFYMKKFKNPILKIFEPFPELEVENLFKKYEEKVDVLTRLAAQPLPAGDASSSLSGMKLVPFRSAGADDPPRKKNAKRPKRK